MSNIRSFFRLSLLAGLLALLSGCATTNPQNGVNDPFQGYNRAMYKFNDVVDKAVLKPVAKGYVTVVPDPFRQGISNFFNNLNDITVIINDVLQGKMQQAFQDTGRFVLNTTVGVAGIFDIASMSGYYKNNEDFGQTLGVWGVDSGPYLVLPIFGPRTVRDSFGLVGDYYSDPVTYVEGPGARNAFRAVDLVQTRAGLLKAERVLDEATAGDEYSYVRDAYLQRRLNLVHDGNPPVTEDDFDIFEDDDN